MTSEERLKHDVDAAIDREIVVQLKYFSVDRARALRDLRDDIRDRILQELRIRWTIVERPRKQTTHRQET